jgi:hypothetical protein
MTKKRNINLLIFFALVFVASCSSFSSTSGHTLLNNSQYSPTENVEVLFEPPSRPYDTFALIEARSYTVPRATIPDLINELKRKAGKLGADAIIISQKSGEVVYLGGQTAPTLSATAIKYK